MVLCSGMDEHRVSSCCHRLTDCTLKCGLRVRYIDLYSHLKNSCSNRSVKCPNKCLVSDNKYNENADYSVTEKSVVTEFLFGTEKIEYSAITDLDFRSMKAEITKKTSNEGTEENKIVKFEGRDDGDSDDEGDNNGNLQGVDEWNRREKNKQAKRSFEEKETEKLYLTEEKDVRSWERIYEIRAELVDVHIRKECPNRVMTCGLCAESVVAKSLLSHKSDTCQSRVVSCPNEGCMKKLCHYELDKHQNHSCRFLLKLCVEGCGELIHAIKMNKHVGHSCAMRYVPCPLNCGVIVRFKLLAAHTALECLRRGMKGSEKKDEKEEKGKGKEKQKFRDEY